MVVLSRRLAWGDHEGSQKAFSDATCRMAWSLGLGIAAVIIGAREPIVETLFGTAYNGAVVPLALLAAQLPLLFITGLQGTVLAAEPMSGASCGSASSSAWRLSRSISSLVPVFQATGAAAVMVRVRVLAFIAFTVRTRRTMQIGAPVRRLEPWLPRWSRWGWAT